MAAKDVVFGDNARVKMVEGVNILAKHPCKCSKSYIGT